MVRHFSGVDLITVQELTPRIDIIHSADIYRLR